jgi:membrane-bound lytic murein transglycosylase D
LKRLLQKNVPLEIKYLAVVESALNPKAVSGWELLDCIHVPNRKQYNLKIDSYIDEQK